MLNIVHIDLAKQALEISREIAITYFDDPGILTNELKDIKTVVDQKMNECIIEELSRTGLPILSEESDSNQQSMLKTGWVIDPLDGTLNFTRKYPCVGISIAYMDNGLPVFGLVKDIFNNITYCTESNGKATKNGAVMKVSSHSEFNNAILATGFPSGGSYDSTELVDFVSNVQSFKKIRAIGCASLMLCYVADGIFDVYYERGIYIWDIAAGLALVKAAGGEYFIKPMDDLFKYEVLAANSEIFEKSHKRFIKS